MNIKKKIQVEISLKISWCDLYELNERIKKLVQKKAARLEKCDKT